MGVEDDEAREVLAAINTLLRPAALSILYKTYPPHIVESILDGLRNRIDEVSGKPKMSVAAPILTPSQPQVEAAPANGSSDAPETSASEQTSTAHEKPLSDPAPPAGEKRKRSQTQRLVETYGCQEVTFMTHWVILSFVSKQQLLQKANSVSTIFEALKKAELVDATQRASVVTSLNRLKNEKKCSLGMGLGKRSTLPTKDAHT